MHNGRIRIAGPTDDRIVGQWVSKTKTLMALRERIHEAATTAALPPHARRPQKGDGKWPRRMRLQDLRL